MKYLENRKKVFMIFVIYVFFMMKFDMSVLKNEMKEFVDISMSYSVRRKKKNVLVLGVNFMR